jgi:hypothetical protein
VRGIFIQNLKKKIMFCGYKTGKTLPKKSPLDFLRKLCYNIYNERYKNNSRRKEVIAIYNAGTRLVQCRLAVSNLSRCDKISSAANK